MLYLPCRMLLGGRGGVGLVLKKAKAVGHTAVLQEGRVSGCRTIKALAIMGPFLFSKWAGPLVLTDRDRKL